MNEFVEINEPEFLSMIPFERIVTARSGYSFAPHAREVELLYTP